MSANSALDGADVNENSNGNGSAISSDPGLLRSEEGISVNIESSDATSEEVGVIANGDLVNSSEGGTVIAAEESNSYADAEFSVTSDAHQAYDTVMGKMDGGVGDGTSNNHAGKLDIVDVHSSLEQVDDQVTNDNGILINMDRFTQDQSDDDNHYEDAGKEEMFVDAPDHMTAVEGRVLDGGEFKAIDETGPGDSEKDIDVRVIEGESPQGMADDLVLLHAQLDKAIAEKELVARECNEYKDEREVLAREICKFHHQLQALSYQHSLLMEDRDGLVDRLRRVETEGCEVKAPASDMPLHVMVGECSKLTSVLKSSLHEQLQCEGTVRELNAVLFTKDQEIEDLNAKVTELSVSRDVLLSYMNSLQKMWTESLQESALHLEVFTDRSLASLASVVPQGDMSHISVTDKISLAEKSTALLIENYTRFLSGINHLGQCLAEVRSDFTMSQENEFGVIFELAREELLGHKKRESDLIDKLQRIEENNQKLLEELDKAKQRLDEANTGANKMKAELEQVEVKLASSKEKLSMAVTKGKALVQQRDSLRQSLNEKTNDLEKCLLDLQQKSSALEAAEVIKEEMIKSKNLVTSLEESVSERNMVLKELEELMSLDNSPEEVQSLPVIDRMRWLVNQKSILEGVFLESRKVKDALSLIDIPETVSSAELESQISWLGRSFAQAKDDLTKLQGEFAGSLEAVASHESELSEASKEIEHIKGSLLEEKLEKDSLQARLEDLTHKYEGIVDKVSLVSAEKDELMRKLLEFSEITMDDQGVDEPSSDPNLLVEKCIGKIRESMSISSQSALVEREHLQNLQSLLYVRDQELMLCKKMLEEEMFDRSHMANLSNELRRVTEELDATKAERDSLQKDLMRAEEKSSLIREKLSMAVKKGKGLVLEREGFKLSLDEKNAKIEKLTHELQQRDSDVSELIDQIKKLSIDVESIPKLESDAIAMREQKDKIEQLLLKNNDKLQALVASIEHTVLPTDIVFEDHVEKLKWLSEYIHELQVGKTSIEQELEKAKEEASQQVCRLVDAYATMKSLEDALSQANNNISILGIEKNDAEVGKIHAQKEFEKEKEEAGLLAQKLADAQETIKYLEDSLSEAEKNIFMLTSEMRDAEVGKAEVEKELEKVKEEACSQTSKLSDAYATITSLEVALSDAEKNISMLCETSKDVQVGKVSVEQELEKSKQEADSLASKLADTYLTIKSLEDRLAQAENKISKLSDEEEAESKSKQEITALNVKLAACLEDLAASDGKLQNHCSQMVTHVNHLETLMKEEGLFSSLNESFKIKFEGLRDMGLLLQSIRQQLAEKDSEQLQFHHGKVDPFATIHFSVPQFNDVNSIVSDEISTADLVDNISSYLSKIVEGFNAQYKFLGEKIEGFSSSMDEHISRLLQELHITKDEVIRTLELVQSLKLNASKLEARNQAQESQIFTLKNSTSILLSAFTDATRELQSEIHNSWDPNSMPVLKSLNYSFYSGSREADTGVVEEQCDSFDTREYVKAGEDLLLAVRSFQAQSKYLENEKSVWLTTVNDLQNKLEESKIMAENAMHDRESNLNKISMLESDLESLNGYYTDLKLKIEDCQTKEEKLREKEAELSLLHHCLAEKDQEAEKCFLSVDEMETLLDKVNKMEIISGESEADIRELNFPRPVDKLFYTIDNFVELQCRMNSLTHDKGELQLTLTAQVSEIEHLKQEAEILTRNNQDLERKMWDLEELTVGLDKLIHKLGGNDSVDDKKSFDAKGLLQVLEKLVITSLMEHENSKSKSQELGAKLNEKQMTLDQFSARVKLLEDSHHEKQAPSDTIQERSIFNASSLATGSEISEIEDVGPLGKNSISPALAAPHARTMRKGSSDHLALSIDLESDRLISHHESDDKGHVFKSLNTSGLIPKQGKLIADKIDGIWVSGGRILMSRPGARIGLIAYWLLLHMWVLGTIL